MTEVDNINEMSNLIGRSWLSDVCYHKLIILLSEKVNYQKERFTIIKKFTTEYEEKQHYEGLRRTI